MLKRYLAAVSVSALLLTTSLNVFAATEQPAQTEQTSLSAEEEQYVQQAQEFWDSLDRKTGKIQLANNAATVDVSEQYYFLNAKDAGRVLVELWGNPPDQSILGMLIPAQYTPFDPESWAVTISYEQDGYVSDEDAADINYNDLLVDMQKDTADASKERIKQGYEAIQLVGWASKPYYDAQTNKLHWAKELKFGDQQVNTLNYNIRMLGRKGVLVLNFIAGMEQKQEIDTALPNVVAMADFNEGARYVDFNPDIDEVAAYGIGALVAGKVIAKTGFLAVILLFLKKFGVFIVIGIGALIGKVFSRKKNTESA